MGVGDLFKGRKEERKNEHGKLGRVGTILEESQGEMVIAYHENTLVSLYEIIFLKILIKILHCKKKNY